MDVEISISISLSINKLQDLLCDEETTSNPRLQKEIQTAINNLHALNQFLKDLDPRTAKILKEVYSVEDATDTFLMIKEIQHIENSREQDQRKDSVSYAQKMKFFCSHKKKASYQIHFARKMEKFNDEARHLLERKGAETSDIENINNTRLLRLQNDRDHLRQRQHWGRISNFCLEDETHVVGLQQQTNDLVVRLIPQLIRNDGQSGGNEIQDLDDLRHCDQVISDFCLEDETHVKLIPQLIPNEGQSGGNEIQFLDNHQHRDQVIAVVGEGGSGKTTLARSVYNRVDVKRHFTIRAWVRIPSVFKARDVLVDILAQINQDELVDATISEDGLMRRLNKVLKGTRFLIVLDDVETLQVWKSLVTTLSFSAQGGKIIIIVRNTDYLPPNGHYSTLNLCKLNNEESWKLFLNKVRIAEEELNNNSDLILLKEQILKICGGLPSTIVLLGGLLSTKEKSCEEWSRVLIAIVANNSTSEDILGLIYQDLPSEVKPCFLYMGLFPKRFEIPVRRLIHLWCAEGILTTPVPIKIDPEDVAEMFLEEIVTRNMVDVVRWVADGVPKTCCMPNVIYDFFSSKAANHVGFQRLAANVVTDYLPSSLGCIQNTRSYVAFDTRVPITSTMAIDEFIGRITGKRGFGLLRVLDVEGVYRPFLSSDQIGRLFLLTYLSLRSTSIDHLPEWVRYMPYLETLDVKHTNIAYIRLSKANRLRHLYLNSTYDPDNSSYLPDSTNLRTLQGLIIPSSTYRIAEYSNAFQMIRLVKLGLLRCEDAAATLPAVVEWINQLTELQSLKLKLIDSKGSVSFIRLWSLAEHHKLQELYLLARLPESVINVGFLPPNLRKLTLSLSELEADPMPVLGKLPHLNILRLLSRSYVGEKMTCLSTGFPKLRILKLWDLRVLQVWTVEEGAMPCLRELEIRSCNSLKLPQELKNATNLKELVLTNMPDDFRAAAEECFHGRDAYVRNNNPRNSDPIQWPTQNPYDAVAKALKGLTFIATKSGEEGNDWNAVEKRFDKLNASTNDPNLEVTLEIRDDSVADPIVHMVTVGGGEEGEIHDNSVASLSRIPSGRSTMTSKRYNQKKSVADALKGLKFITTTKSGEEGNDWNAVEKRFDELTASTNGLLHSSMFGECIGMKGDSKEFAGELFRAVAQKHKINGESINKTQLEDFWHQISDASFDSRLKTFFDIVDKDANGRITKEEIKELISLSASANKLSNIQKQAEEYAALIMEVLDPEKVGYTMVNKLDTLLLQAPNKYEKVLSKKHKPTLLLQAPNKYEKVLSKNNPLERWYQEMKYFLIYHWQKVWILMLWLGIVSGLFVYMFVQYRNKAAYDVMGNCVCIAKGAAETLKFNMALILLPVCRKTITWLRNHTKLGGVVPFDNNLDFHMVIAAGIAIGVILHGGAHLTCDFPRLIHATKEEYEPMKPYFGEEQPQNYWWFLKGVEGVTGIIMVVLMAIAFTLANPWFQRNKLKNMPEPFKWLTSFNAFWYSQHLFVIVYVLLIVHGIYIYLSKTWYQKTTWMYIAVPVLLYTCERLIRAFRSSTETVEIIKAHVYPDVLALRMSKPESFKYESGQYMFVNCSAVSPFEWHPFSITSAPGDDYLSVHIRILGDWTRQLNSVFSKVCQPAPSGRSGVRIAEGTNDPGFPKISIDGPYGAPAQEYKNYDVVLLVGLGIGATPMISIVKDIINNMETEDNSLESDLENGTANKNNNKKPLFKTRKAYMYLVTREQKSFEWFREIMNEMAEMDKKRVIELHNYCTNVYEEGDARSALISMVQSLQYAKNGVDVVSETRVKSHFAKPNWRKVYKQISLHHPGSRIGVLYCGKPAAMKEIKQLASEFSHSSSTKFDFHKENF